MTTTVTYTVNFAGDFVDMATFAANYGTDWQTSSTGNLAQAGSTSTTIVLSLTDAITDPVGHPVTSGGETHLITAYNSGTRVATISARAGFTGTWTSTPTVGQSYTIADVAVVATVGQSASGTNRWNLSAVITYPNANANTSANTLTINGATAWNPKYSRTFNSSGAVTQPVYFYTNSAGGGADGIFNFAAWSGGKVTINNIQFNADINNPAAIWYDHSQINLNGCMLRAANPFFDVLIGTSTGNSFVIATNCDMFMPTAHHFLNGGISGNTRAYGCAFYGVNKDGVTASGMPLSFGAQAIDCWFYKCDGFGGTTTNCAGDVAQSGCTALTMTDQIAALGAPTIQDMRTRSTSAMIGAGGTNANLLTDIYGTTRSLTNITIGPQETGTVVPALQAVNYNFAASGGDYASPCPNGTVSSGSWAAGVGTVTTSGPHGMVVGTTPYVSLGGIGGSAGWSGVYTATVTGASTFTVPITSNPGSVTGTLIWINYVFTSVMGGPNGTTIVFGSNPTPASRGGDLTWSSGGKTCSGNGTTTTILLDTTDDARCIGHPIRWKTNPYCMIIAFDDATHTATIAAIAGYAATLGGSPLTGDAYDIAPISLTLTCGLAGPGNTGWDFNVFSGSGTAMQLGPFGTSSVSTVTLKGSTAFNAASPAGTPSNSGSAIYLRNGDDSNSNPDHVSPITIACGFLTIQNIQVWCSNKNQEDGVFSPGANVTTPVTIREVIAYGTNGTNDFQHSGLFGQSQSILSNVTMINVIGVGTNFLAKAMSQQAAISPIHCTFVNTANTIKTTVGTTASGSNTITLSDVIGVQPQPGGANTGMVVWVTGGQIPYDTDVLSISGNTITLNHGVTTTGSIAAGTQIFFGIEDFVGDGRTTASKNSAFFGFSAPHGNNQLGTMTTCASDANPFSQAGLTTMSYGAQFNAATGLTATTSQPNSGNPGVTVDVRPKAGNGLQIGTFDATVPLDLFGRARANPPTVGAIEFIVASASTAHELALMGAGT